MVKSERNVNQRGALPPNQDPTLMAYPSNRTCWSLSGLPGSSCCCCNRDVTGNSIRQEMLVDTLTHHVLLFATATNNAHNQMSFTLRGGGPDDRSRMTQLQRQKLFTAQLKRHHNICPLMVNLSTFGIRTFRCDPCDLYYVLHVLLLSVYYTSAANSRARNSH